MSSQNNVYTGNRCEYLDCVKGVAILCITFLHFENGVIPQWLNSWIGMFMITTFYFTSGWIFGLKDSVDKPKDLFRKRIRQLGIPYLWFGALIIVFDIIWVLCGLMEPHIIAREIYKWVTLRGIGTLWFLPVLLFGELLFCFVKSSSKPILTGFIAFAITLVASYFYYEHWMHVRNDSQLYQVIDSPMRPIVMSLGAWPIIAAGYITCKKLSGHIASMSKWLSALTGAVILVLSIWFVIAPPFNFFYINGFISNILPEIGLIGIFVLIARSYAGRFFSYWGRNSLIMMCTHFSIVMEIIMVFDRIVMGHTNFCGWSTIYYFIIAVLATYPLVWLFNGKLSFMLGKKRNA